MMPVIFDAREAALAAVVAYYQQALGNDFLARVGWVGNDALPVNKHVLAFQIVSDNTTPFPVVVIDHDDPGPDDEPVAQAVVEYGRIQLGVTATLYVQSQQQGKTLRSDAVRRVLAVIPRIVGKAPALILPPSENLPALLHFCHEETTLHDEPEGIKRNEWRATIRFTLRTSLVDSAELPYCRQIETSLLDDPYRPVDAVLP
ncbi:hypothetical protein GC173_11570 [bacterium]|nr:hypothetical protein [bacterium]